ncbi:MAG: ATP-binding protein [Thermoplasmata archaeon]
MKSIKALFIDKDGQELRRAKSYLKKENEHLDINIAQSGKKALDMMDSKDFNLIVFSIDSSTCSDLLKNIFQKKEENTPIIIYADEKYPALAVKSLNLGVDAYLVKHTENDLEQLSKTIEEKVKKYNSNSNNKVNIKEDDFRSFLDSISDWVWEMDKEGVHTYSNSAVKDILGYEIDEVVDHSAWKLWPDKDKENIDKEEFKEYLKDGKTWKNFASRFKHKDGKTKYLESTGIPIYDEDDNLLGYRGMDRDITEKRRAQKRERFLHSLLRHDIKNKIQITKGYLQLMDDVDSKDEFMDSLNKAKESLDEEENLIDKISYLREIDEKDEVSSVNLKTYIEKGIDNNISFLEESEVDVLTDGLDKDVMGGELLEELFKNLIENSLNHSNCETISITAEDDSENLKIIFEDDGDGIPKDKKKVIFDKNYKGSKSKGSGLGLFLVKRIVDTYGGEITVKDSSMGGARFDIRLNTC